MNTRAAISNRMTSIAGLAMSFVTAAAIFVGASAVQQAGDNAAQKENGTMLPCYVEWSGPHSKIRKQSFKRITDGETWRSLWQEHEGEEIEMSLTDWPVVPRVNFDACEVIAVLGGVKSQCNGYLLASVVEFDDHIRIRYNASTFQIGIGFDETFDESKYRGTPYGFFVIPKSDKMIIIEEDVRRLINADPEWEEKFRFPAR